MVLAGCASSTAKVGAPANVPSAATPSTGRETLAIEPSFDQPTPLRLERLGRKLEIGADESALREVFPKPEGAYEFNDLPSVLRGSFESTGWEGRNEGFGAILYGGKVALAMRQFYEIDGARFDELFRTLQNANRGVTRTNAEGRNAEFWFWESGSQILMALRRGVKGNRYDLTIALGDKAVMDALEMTPAKANGIIETLRADPNRKDGGVGAPTPRDRTETKTVP